MQAIDTNVLVFAEVRASPQHRIASSILRTMAEGAVPWAIPWPCVYEFVRVITHPRVYHPPLTMRAVLKELGRLLEAPTLVLLHETERHTEVLIDVLEQSGATGNLVHDAHIAALCIEHGITELITGDRDFTRFPSLKVRNPFA